MTKKVLNFIIYGVSAAMIVLGLFGGLLAAAFGGAAFFFFFSGLGVSIAASRFLWNAMQTVRTEKPTVPWFGFLPWHGVLIGVIVLAWVPFWTATIVAAGACILRYSSGKDA